MTVTKDMTIAQILELDREGVAPIFFESGMHCLGCAMASGESLEEACQVHGIDADVLISSINRRLEAAVQL